MIDRRISLTGIRASGRHGANPGERDAPQEFVVDLDVVVEQDDRDDLDDTLDYRVIVQTVRECIQGSSFVLVETLADAVAREVYGLPRVVRVNATVHKPGAARSLDVDDVSVEAIVG
jgi:dihydroneopterin aldolase